MSKVYITIITGEKVVFREEADQISIPTQVGFLTILPNHIPLVGIVTTGKIELQNNNTTRELAISSGILEIRPGSNVIILADRSEFAEEIDVARAEEAYKRAQLLMTEKAHEADVDFARFESMIDKELNRVSVGQKYNSKKH